MWIVDLFRIAFAIPGVVEDANDYRRDLRSMSADERRAHRRRALRWTLVTVLGIPVVMALTALVYVAVT